MNFPPDFLWGSGISSYQVEGDNKANDWFEWEIKQHLEPAGKSTDHYHLFRDDISLAHSLGHNALRFSIEWSRIFPSKKSIAYDELTHYRKVVSSLRENNIVPLVTLHHFTNPLWFVHNGGWSNPSSVDSFLFYVKTTVHYLQDYVRYWIIFNEPLVYIYNGFITGLWPPGVKSVREAMKALNNILRAYTSAYKEIKNIYSKRRSYISIAKHMRVFSPCFHMNAGQNNILAYLRSYLFNFKMINYLSRKKCLDFIGLNYYCREFVKWGTILGRECNAGHHTSLRNDMGWFIYPRGLYCLLMKLKKYNIPVIITENGTSDISDNQYNSFMHSHIENVAKAIYSGVDVRGYFWWSLLDNFEWDKGYKPKFGLARVDFSDFSRKLKGFSLKYKEICNNNVI